MHTLFTSIYGLFITCGSWIKVTTLLYGVTLAYSMIKSLIQRPVLYLYSVMLSSYFRSHLVETINNYTFYLFSSESQFLEDVPSFIFPFSSRLITITLENFEYPWNVQTSMFLFLCLLNVFLVLKLLKVIKQCGNMTQGLREYDHRWHSTWENMCRYLENYSPPVV